MRKIKSSSSNDISEALCLNRLGAHLLQFFPLSQVQDVLADYQEYLSLGRERKTSTEGLLQELRNPAGIRRALLDEMPNGRRFFFLWTGGFGALFLLTLYVCLHSFSSNFSVIKVLPLMVGLSGAFFALLHGRARIVLEQQLGIPPLKKSFWFVHLFLLALTVLTEYTMQRLLVRPPESIPAYIGIWRIGPAVNMVLCSLIFLITLLLIWSLFQTQNRSIQYYPAAVHALGTIFFLLDIRAVLHCMNLDIHDLEMLRQAFVLPIYWYNAGLLLAGLFVSLFKSAKRTKAV